MTFKKELKGVVECSEYIDSLMKYSFKRCKYNDCASSNGTVPIKKAKIDNVGKITQYIPDEFNVFYESLAWPASERDNDYID